VAAAAPLAGVGRALLLSDVHLSEAHPRTTEVFFRFLARAKSEHVDALYILGDLFEYWAGDDDLLEPLNRKVLSALREFVARGTAVFVITGNRDLLMNSGFAHSSGASILADPSEVEIGGHRLLISHGDAYCTDDHAYQAYRQSVRSPAWQKEFLAKPLTERKVLIASMRAASESAKASKSEAIMDVNPQAIAALFRSTGATCLVHGHTHRPGQHDLLIDGVLRKRWVLPDWDGEAEPVRGGGLLADRDGLQWLGLEAVR
jgi:UDP-2,3-diacylglucosamine hydrolase